MVEKIQWIMPLSLFFAYGGFFLAIGLPYPYSTIVGLGCYSFTFIPIVIQRVFIKIIARGFSVIKVLFTSRDEDGLWRWSIGPHQVWFKRDPTSKWMPNYIFKDGTPGCYQTVINIARGAPRHPRYNRRARMQKFIILHKQPFSALFKQSEASVNYESFPVTIRDVSWCIADEIMPDDRTIEVIENGKKVTKPINNHAFFTDETGFQHPRFWVTEASGTRALEEKARDQKKVTIENTIVATGAGQALCHECGAPLKVGNGPKKCEYCGHANTPQLEVKAK